MREQDPDQRDVDAAVIEAGEELRDESQQALALLINHAFVAAHGGPGKGG